MKPKRDEQRYQETLAAMREALGFKHGQCYWKTGARPHETLLELELHLWWGRPKCEVRRASSSTRGTIVQLHVTVRPDWLDRVWNRGLAMADGVLVLHAEEAPELEPAEEAWLAVVCVSKADWSEARPQLTYIVRYGGILRCGLDQQEALYRAIADYANALGVEPPEEAKRYLDQRSQELLATRAKKARDYLGGQP